MFFSDEHISEGEKIDRIYKMLRSERRGRIIYQCIKLFIFFGILYGVYYLSLPTHVDLRQKVNDFMQEKMMEFITPMVGNMVQNLTGNIQLPPPVNILSTGSIRKNLPKTPQVTQPSPMNITPEMIKAVQDAMQKK